MPITVRNPGSIRAIGKVAQLAGEGAYVANVLNPLATSDTNRNVSTQLSLLDLQEGARRTNVSAAVNRMNTMQQIEAQRRSQQFSRETNERMAQFQSLDAMQRLQATGGLNAQAAAERFRQQQQLGEQQFGYSQELQEQQGSALNERQQAQFRQADRTAMIQSHGAPGYAVVAKHDLMRQRARDEQHKLGRLREEDGRDEFQQSMRTIDQMEMEALQALPQQPTLQQRFDQEVLLIPDKETGIDVPWVFDQNSRKFQVAQGFKYPQKPDPPKPPAPFFSPEVRLRATTDWNNLRQLAWERALEAQPDVETFGKDDDGNTINKKFKEPLNYKNWSEEYESRNQQPTFYEREGSQGMNSAGFDAQPQETNNKEKNITQPQKISNYNQQNAQLLERVMSGELDNLLPALAWPVGLDQTPSRRVLRERFRFAINGVRELEIKYGTAANMPAEAKLQAINWNRIINGLKLKL